MPAETEVVEFKRAQNSFSDTDQGHYYGRDGESLVALNLHEIELIRAQAHPQEDWSAEIVPDATIDDLDPEAIRQARKNYAEKHKHLEEEMKAWTDIEFLNYAKVTRNGRITNTAIILLGKPQSEVLISLKGLQLK